MFPDVKLERYTRLEALKIVLQRFAYRMVWFDTAMAKSFYKIPEKEIKVAVAQLVEDGLLVAENTGYLLANDVEHLKNYEAVEMHFVYPIHRNDIKHRKHNKTPCKGFKHI